MLVHGTTTESGNLIRGSVTESGNFVRGSVTESGNLMGYDYMKGVWRFPLAAESGSNFAAEWAQQNLPGAGCKCPPRTPPFGMFLLALGGSIAAMAIFRMFK